MGIPVQSQLTEGSIEDAQGTRKDEFTDVQVCRAPFENDSPLLFDNDDDGVVPADEIICRLCPRWPPFVAVRCLLVLIAALWGSKIAVRSFQTISYFHHAKC